MCRNFVDTDGTVRFGPGRLLILVCCVAIQAACSSTEPRVASNLTAESPTSLSGVVGQEVSPSPSVLVTDKSGSPVAGESVIFSDVYQASGGSIVVTNSAGIATAKWVLGTLAAPDANVMVATIRGAANSVRFTATAVAGPPHSIHAVTANGFPTSPDGQHAPAGTAVPIPPSVLIMDAYGNPIVGVAVTFAIGQGGGSVTGANATTDAQGIATVGSWTLGSTGTNTLIATGPGGLTITFTAQAD